MLKSNGNKKILPRKKFRGNKLNGFIQLNLRQPSFPFFQACCRYTALPFEVNRPDSSLQGFLIYSYLRQ